MEIQELGLKYSIIILLLKASDAYISGSRNKGLIPYYLPSIPSEKKYHAGTYMKRSYWNIGESEQKQIDCNGECILSQIRAEGEQYKEHPVSMAFSLE